MYKPKLFHNIATLGIFQVVNMLLSLVMIPYLVRILGAESWGRIVFVLMIVNYLNWFCNWGFYLNGTRKVSEQRNNAEALTIIFQDVFSAQIVLTVIAVIGFILWLLIVHLSPQSMPLYLWAIGLIVANTLMPFWFLNGLEMMTRPVFIQILIKIFSIPVILFFVNKRSDAYIYIIATTIPSLVMGVATIFWMKRKFALSFTFAKWKNIHKELKESTTLFISTMLANLNTSFVPTILGIVAGPAMLGYYNVADRVRSAAITMLQPISNALYPRMCSLFAVDQNDAKVFLKRFGIILFSLSGITSLGIYFFADKIILVAGGGRFISSVELLKWVAFTPFFNTVSAFYVHQVIIPAQKNKVYTISMFVTLTITVLLSLPMICWKQARGASIVIFMAELSFALVTAIYCWRNNNFLLKENS